MTMRSPRGRAGSAALVPQLRVKPAKARCAAGEESRRARPTAARSAGCRLRSPPPSTAMPTGRNSKRSRRSMSHRRNGAAVASATVALSTPETDREFDFTDADFRFLVQFAREHAGIALAESKRNLIYSRLSRRLRALRPALVSRLPRLSGRQQRRDWKASSTRSRPISPNFSASRIISSICASMSRPASREAGCTSPARACESGRPAARPARSLTRSPPCSSAKFPNVHRQRCAYSRHRHRHRRAGKRRRRRISAPLHRGRAAKHIVEYFQHSGGKDGRAWPWATTCAR